MSLSRREFLHDAAVLLPTLSALAGSTLAHGAPTDKSPKPGSKKILILGGTGFLGPATVQAALARGHSVTIFNRGQTEKRKPLEFPDVERLYGNRDPNKHSDEGDDKSPLGLDQLKNRSWDAVIDNSGYYPRMVKASAELLKNSVGHYLFISSVSAFARNDLPGSDETAPVATLEDPTVETMGDQQQHYGGLKALCEKACEESMPGRVSNVRPGYIVGPGDPTDRFTYWPVRADRGGEILAPGSSEHPTQIIDVRDLGEWLVRLVENKSFGVFNALGPAKTLTWGEVLTACVSSASKPATLTWVDPAFLRAQEKPGDYFPIWIPPEGEYAGFHRWSNARAVAAGLTFRPVADTVRDTLKWWPTELERRIKVTAKMKDDAKAAGKPEPQMPDPSVLRAGVTPAREAELLEAWKKRG